MQAKIRSILAAADLEASTAEVLGMAGALASHVRANLHVVHVVESGAVTEAAVLGADPPEDDDAGEASRLLRERIRVVLAGIEPESQEVRAGAADQAILHRAREVGADLVIVGPHRHGGMSAHMLGSTAERVVRGADVPCLVARGSAKLPFNDIGVATDLSPASAGAVAEAAEWARLFGNGSLRALHIGLTIHQGGDYEAAVARPGLEQVVAGAPEGVRVDAEFEWAGNEAEGIVAWAARRRLHLLVVGTQGRGGIERALLGSTAVAVARKAHCPVLLTPPLRTSEG